MADVTVSQVGWLRDNDVLAPVVVSSAIAEVLSLLDSCLTVALIEVGNDLSVQILNLLFERRQCLNSNLMDKMSD